MSRWNVGRSGETMRKFGIGLVLAFICLTPPLAVSQSAPLNLLNNYFVTGDYVVGGVGLRGLGDSTGYAKGIINIPDSNPSISPGISGTNSVPAGAQIVAAFLYWETIESSQAPGSGKNGFFRPIVANGPSTGYSITGVSLVSSSTNGPVAWSSGGCSGSSQGNKTMQPYRADVLPLLAQDSNGNVLANTAYEVRLADSGSQSSAPVTLGATLVLIYRVLSQNFQLNSVILYDGAFSPTNSSAPMSQAIQGFYEPASSPFARLTQIVGNGQSNKYEQVLFGNASPTALNPLGTSVFPGYYNASWDNPTWNVSNYVHQNDSSETIQVVPNANQSGCVSWGAVIFSTTVQSSDGDGLLDVWKQNHGYTDVGTGQAVDLTGATPGHKDVFMQLDYMVNSAAGTSFAPNQSALSAVQQALQNHNIYMHFGTGHTIDETHGGPAQACSDLPGPPAQYCIYPGQPGMVTWTSGFLFLKNQPLNQNSDGTYWTESQCEQNPTTCVRRFNPALKDSYHYALFGDRLGAPNWNFVSKTLTSVTQAGNLVTFNTSVPHGLAANDSVHGNGRVTVYSAITNTYLNGTYLVTSVSCPTNPVSNKSNDCASGNTAPGPYTFTIQIGGNPSNASFTMSTDPNLAVASGQAGTSSGISDVGGANSVITLGGWGSDGTTDAVQAGTFMHELGHAFGLTHGGFRFDKLASNNNDYTPTIEANCKPNFQSVMNYLFQVDLLDNGSGFNVPDYSEQELIPLGENNLGVISALSTVDGGLPTTYLSTEWYATSAANGVGTPARTHCDGTPIVATDPDKPMFRWTGSTSALPWSNGNSLDASGNLDINFDGKFEILGTPAPPYGLRGQSDWNNVDPRQVGATGSLSVAGGGGFANGGGGFANGGGGFANGGGGFANGGGGFANGGGGFANGGGGFANGGGGFANGGVGELDVTAANSVTRPPRNLTAVVNASPLPRFASLSWAAPSFGTIGGYNVYRSTNGAQALKIATVTGASLGYDDHNVVCGPTYTYFVTALLAGTTPPQESVASNTAPRPPLSVCAPPYTFNGFSAPLASTNQSNTNSYSGNFLLGSPLPIVWTLQDSLGNGVPALGVNTLLAIGPAPLVNGACPTPGSVPVFFNNAGNYPYTVSTLYSPQNGFQAPNTFLLNYPSDPTKFSFTWSTASVAAGCYVLELDLDSGQVERTALKLAAPYIFTGFGSPLTTADPPSTGSYSGKFNIGKSVTAKWQLQTSNGTLVSSLTANSLLAAVGPIPVPTSGTSAGKCPDTLAPVLSNFQGSYPYSVQTLYSPSTGAKGGSTFRFSSPQFVFNWDTSTNTPGCYVLELDLDNGQVERTGLQF